MSKSAFRTLAELVTGFENLGVIDCEDVVEYHFCNDGSGYHHFLIRREGFEHPYELELLERVFKEEYPSNVIINKNSKDKYHFTFEARVFESPFKD